MKTEQYYMDKLLKMGDEFTKAVIRKDWFQAKYLYDKASRLIPFMAPGMSVSVYVSNIVEEHLKRHGELLKDELERFLYKDSLWKN